MAVPGSPALPESAPMQRIETAWHAETRRGSIQAPRPVASVRAAPLCTSDQGSASSLASIEFVDCFKGNQQPLAVRSVANLGLAAPGGVGASEVGHDGGGACAGGQTGRRQAAGRWQFCVQCRAPAAATACDQHSATACRLPPPSVVCPPRLSRPPPSSARRAGRRAGCQAERRALCPQQCRPARRRWRGQAHRRSPPRRV